ncbi:hypothetical protein RI367_008783 [Sorochytrium milnesiophthora]
MLLLAVLTIGMLAVLQNAMQRPWMSPLCQSGDVGLRSVVGMEATAIDSVADDAISKVTIAPEKPLLHAKDIAIVTYLVAQGSVDEVYFSYDTFRSFAGYTMENMKQYAHRFGHPFFFANAAMVNTNEYAAYWGKMAVMQHYMDNGGYEWILWTDIDVLFTDFAVSLTSFFTRADEHHHLLLVRECLPTPTEKYGKVRSGFFAVRNTPTGRQFLRDWRDSYEKYHTHFNPEQTSMEDMLSTPYWKERALIYLPEELHTYPECLTGANRTTNGIRPFSVHFPGSYKSLITEWADYLDVKLPKNDFKIAL